MGKYTRRDIWLIAVINRGWLVLIALHLNFPKPYNSKSNTAFPIETAELI